MYKKLSSEDADINSNIISEDFLKIYNKKLNEFIDKAYNKGVMAVKSSDSEFFMQNLKEKGLNLGEIGRDFYLKELDSVIKDINKNLSVIQRLQKRSQEEGIEAGKKLRENVKKALELMGDGLINSSKAFTDDILKGNLDIKEFYQELLRITYRIIFILYAEAKNLLPTVATIYYNDLGLTFLRKKAQQAIRDDQNTDMWYRLLLLFKFLDLGEKSLGINAFSGELFNQERIHVILDENYNLTLPNSILLRIIRELTIVDLGIGLQLIDYSEIGEEEIGGIYEALLDFQPRYMKQNTPTFHFILEEIDTERKGSSTYYTPKGLINILLKTALKPVVESKLNGLETKDDKLKALLELKICDPACGGGSFLLASIDYLGKIYAQIKSNEEFPEDIILRESRRKILQHCIYGVDLNPMALELAKVSLWLKALVRNKPLTFLDNHLKMGNSLVGFVKKQIIGNIAVIAFNYVKGSSKTGIPDEFSKFVNDAKKKLKDFSIEKNSSKAKALVQKTLLPYKDSEKYSEVAYKVYEMEENNIDQLREKMLCYLELIKSNSWKNLNLQCNLWTSSFFWDMGDNHIRDVPTDTLISKAKKGDLQKHDVTIEEVYRLNNEYKYFNWYLEFPEVFNRKSSGFDCLLMNPPWDVINLNEMEFFAGKNEEIINTQNRSERQKEILNLKRQDPKLHEEYITEYRKIKKTSYYFRKSNKFPLSAKGSINLFALFIERSQNLINNKGKIGAIVPTTLITGKNMKDLFQHLIKNKSFDTCFSFINRLKIFPIGDKLQFSVIALSSIGEANSEILMSFYTWRASELEKNLESYENKMKIDETNRRIEEGGSLLNLNIDDFSLFNPNSQTSPLFRREMDYILVKKAYLKAPVFKKGRNSPWKISFNRLIDSALDSNLFNTLKQMQKYKAKPENNLYNGGKWYIKESGSIKKTYLPLYTGSSIWFYDYRYNDLIPRSDKSLKKKSQQVRVSNKQHNDSYCKHVPMYWIDESIAKSKMPVNWDKNWYVGYRDISGSDNARSFVFSSIPRYPFMSTLNVLTFELFKKEIICLIGNLSSIPLDFIARNKISGMHFSQFIVEQLPVFPPRIYSKPLYNEIQQRVLELVYTSWEMKDFAVDFGLKDSQIPFKWNFNRREILKSEIHAIFSLMYGYNKKELEYILSTFSRLRINELRNYGEFLTKKLVLKAFKRFNSDPELGPLFRLEGVHIEKIKGE